MSRALLVLLCLSAPAVAADPWLVFPGGDGPGKGKHVVLISGDEEYRSEEVMPALAKILSTHHGFKCTVLFAIDKETGNVNPNEITNVPGLEALRTADLMVIFLRWRILPDDQLAHIAAYLESGKPVVGLRTSTHAFKETTNPAFKKYMWNSKEPGWDGGFGRTVLGETWVAHHGAHGKEGTRGVVAPGQQDHPILKGIAPGSIFGTSDVYTVKLPLPGDSQPLVLGQVTTTLQPDSPAVSGKKNDPMMPVAWTKTYGDKHGRVFTTTMGAAQDFAHEGTRRMLVNGCYWAVGLETAIPDQSKVDFVGTFAASPFRHKKNEEWKPGKPASEYGK